MADQLVSEKKLFLGIPVFLLLVGYLLIGIANMAVLPPFEGFDETAHYSYLQQLSDTGELPRLKSAKISKDVEEYARHAPVAYSSTPPFENNKGYTYKSFFDSSEHVIHQGSSYIHQHPATPRHYFPGKVPNWQAQHPPLYYLVLSPIYHLTNHLSWPIQFFILRLCSYLLAWVALIVAIACCLIMTQLNSIKQNQMVQCWIIFGTAIVPVLFPSWLPEMARIGNVSLCALIMSLVWYVSLRACQNGLRLTHSAILGVLLGLGCLTKVFFVPVAAGVFCYWMIRQLKQNGEKGILLISANLSLMLFLIIFISGWWYFKNWHEFGVLSGSDELIQLSAAGGLMHGLSMHFSWFSLARGYAAFVTTIGWCCTWSLARPHYIFLMPLALLSIWTAAAYIYELRNRKIYSVQWMPLWYMLPLVLDLSYHILARIALIGEGTGTGGYYLLFMIASIGAVVGLGYGQLWLKSIFRILTLLLIIYAVIFAVVVSWEQVMLFAGILFKAGSSKFYQFPNHLPHLLGIPEAITRLDAIAFPKTGVIVWIFGEAFIIMGLISGFNTLYLLRREMALGKKDDFAV